MTKKEHIENLSDIMDSMPDDTCGDWRDSIAYAIDAIEKLDKDDDKLDFDKVYKKIAVPLNFIESIKTFEVLNNIIEEIREWYHDADVQYIAEDPCVVDAMIDLFIRTINKYKENEVKMMAIRGHVQNLSDIMTPMPNVDWKDFIAHAIEVLKQVSDDCDDCSSWNNKYEPLKQNLNNDDDTSDNIDQRQKEFIAFIKENLNKGDDTEDNINQIIYQMKKEFIDKYPKNYMGGLELDGRGCVFSLNEILKMLDKYIKRSNVNG